LSLDLGQTYYWKVNEVNEAETPTTWEGDLWNFATREFLVVDDFESYNDLDPAEPDSRRIFNVWKDGYEVPTNGSLVGYETPPFCEQTIVHGGKQSMPLSYDNSTASYSEATANVANLPVGQDWTKYGIKTLVLYFHGDPSNSVEQLYVKLNGSKVTYNGDVANLTQTVWQEWNIELASFGVNLSNVAELSIGLERIGVAGGKGVVYIDDIRLYPSRCVPEHGPAGDIDDDCKVDFSDYAILVHDWFLSDYSIPAKPITQTPVAHWALDEGSGTTTADSAGGHSGTIMGGVGTTWVASKVGAYALHFNGEDNHYVDCGTFNPAQGRNEMTCGVWAKWDGSNNNWQGLVCKRDTWSVSGMMWQIEVNRDDQRVGVFRNGVDGEDNRLYTLEPLPEGEWQHIAFTINNANDTVLYVDGEVIDTANWSLGTGTNAHVLIGATFYAGATGQDCFNGALDDVYLFNDDLKQGQIIKLMGLEERYFPIESPAELYDGEPQYFRSINFRDLKVLAETWLEERLWPAQ